MKERLNKNDLYIAHRIFWICFLILLIIDCVENTSLIYSKLVGMQAMYMFRNLIYLILLVKITFFSTYRQEELVGMLVVFLVCFVGFLVSGDWTLCKFSIIACAAKDEAPRELVTAFVTIKFAALIITLLLWRVGILPEILYQDDQVGYYNTFGFCHRNVLGANMTVICLAWFYLHYHEQKVKDILIWLVIMLVTYKVTYSRTSLIMMCLIISGMYAFSKMGEKLWKLPNAEKILIGIFLGLLLISFFGTIFYSPDWKIWNIIDKIFTKRIRFANQCYQQYGFSLFGQRIPFISSMEAQSTESKRLILDNAYMRVFLYNGFFAGALFIFMYYKALDFSIKKKDEALICCLLVFSVYGMSERYMLDVFYQFPLVIAIIQYFFRANRWSSNYWKSPVEYLKEMIHSIRRRYHGFD